MSVTNVVLAAKDGTEAVAAMGSCGMKELKPNVSAIVASGYLDLHVRSKILKTGVIDTIQKPYNSREMLEKTRLIVGQTNPDDDQPQHF